MQSKGIHVLILTALSYRSNYIAIAIDQIKEFEVLATKCVFVYLLVHLCIINVVMEFVEL